MWLFQTWRRAPILKALGSQTCSVFTSLSKATSPHFSPTHTHRKNIFIIILNNQFKLHQLLHIHIVITDVFLLLSSPPDWINEVAQIRPDQTSFFWWTWVILILITTWAYLTVIVSVNFSVRSFISLCKVTLQQWFWNWALQFHP